ncbi:ATP-dependent Clp protease proteolytic subunit [Defluviimonas aquaemixtae]|uniref:ATP-dependent Clp protease proteolytic subunit n=1 Tax=Albidovulum aquaemixtae TaxID=1542388 RepID=A0A2R8BM50_9RHOB|nr:ATP-dependent Clp protease proteolytic subunit [Defluviimonas aquaemixtae]SPH24479.1 ATP-dependent Clp protease proteolytic subunit [Defluviimonas aquaemixtae]
MKKLVAALSVVLLGTLTIDWFAGEATTAIPAIETTKVDEGDKLKCTGKHKRFVLDDKVDWGLTGKIFDTVIPCLEGGFSQEIVINSPGGSPTTAHGVYEALRIADTQNRLTTTVYGNSHSAAVYVFLAGATRNISCSSTMQIHPVTLRVVASSNDRTELNSFPERWEKTEERSINILAHRTKLTKDEVRELKLGHRLLTAEDALGHGIATEIIGC